jgi:hypothetical protein
LTALSLQGGPDEPTCSGTTPSQLLSFTREEWRRETFPFARALHDKISRDGAETLLFMTWGYKHGDQHNWPGDSFADMQGRLSEGYSALAAELQAAVAPAGLAWGRSTAPKARSRSLGVGWKASQQARVVPRGLRLLRDPHG